MGVGRRYTGTAGKKENCQIGVFVAYASEKGSALVDRELYLPREWSDDPQRLSEAGVPEEVRFATKGRLARVMLRRAFEAEVPARWVLADSIYGADSKFCSWLEERGKCYVLAVHKSTGAWDAGRRYQVRALVRELPETSWVRTSAGEGSKCDRLHDWVCLALDDGLEEVGMCRWLLVRRAIKRSVPAAVMLVESQIPSPPGPHQRRSLAPTAKMPTLSPTPSGNALASYCRSKIRVRGVPGAMTDRCCAPHSES